MNTTYKWTISDKWTVVFIILLSGVTVAYGLVFSFQFASTLLTGILIALMMIGFNGLEFMMATRVKRLWDSEHVFFLIICVLIILTGVVFSMFSNLWVISNSYANGVNERRISADSYQAWQSEKKLLSEKIMKIKGLGIDAEGERRALSEATSGVESLLAAAAFNSNGRNTGRTVSELTNNCTKSSYYTTKYCGNYNELQRKITDIQTRIESVSRLTALENSLVEISKNPPTPAELHAPGIISITRLTGVDENSVMPFVNFLFAICNEFCAIFGWFFVGYSKENQGQKVTVIEPELINSTLPEPEPSITTKPQSQSQSTQLVRKPNGGDIMANYINGAGDDTAKILGAKLRQFIDSRGENVTDFSRAVGVPQASIFEYISGRRLISTASLLRIQDALGDEFNMSEFLKGGKNA